MKICTWNLGLFGWLAYAKFFGLTKNGILLEDQHYSRSNLDFVLEVLNEIQADLFVMQEFHSKEELEEIALHIGYKYTDLVESKYLDHKVGIMSHFPVRKIDQKEGFTVFEAEGLKFIPVHLSPYSPAKRQEQIDSLCLLHEKHNLDLVLGDTNLWSRRDFFVSKRDKRAHEKISSLLVDSTQDLITNRLNASLDKIFIKKELGEKSRMIKKHAMFMDHYPVFIEIN